MTRLVDYIEKKNRQGLAVGQSYILEDEIVFVYKAEKFTFSTSAVSRYCTPDGTFYLAKVKRLRALAERTQ